MTASMQSVRAACTVGGTLAACVHYQTPALVLAQRAQGRQSLVLMFDQVTGVSPGKPDEKAATVACLTCRLLRVHRLWCWRARYAKLAALAVGRHCVWQRQQALCPDNLLACSRASVKGARPIAGPMPRLKNSAWTGCSLCPCAASNNEQNTLAVGV